MVDVAVRFVLCGEPDVKIIEVGGGDVQKREKRSLRSTEKPYNSTIDRGLRDNGV
jgi:hypothetical protein